MSYRVAWSVVGPDERMLVRDDFPVRFALREEAVAFVLDKLAAFPRLGYDRDRGFWGRGEALPACETRFEIALARETTRAG